MSDKLKEIWFQIRANRDRLDACPGHRLPAEAFKYIAPLQKATCTVCGGELTLLEANQYARGYEAAGGNPNDVIPGFKEANELPNVHEAAAHVVANALVYAENNPEENKCLINCEDVIKLNLALLKVRGKDALKRRG